MSTECCNYLEISDGLEIFRATEKDAYIKKQMELGLKSPRCIDRSAWTDDEFEAWYHIMCDRPVPKELRDRILSVQYWEVPLYRILYDEIRNCDTNKERYRRYEYSSATYVTNGNLDYCYFISMQSRSYLIMQENEKERLKQLQERFLEIFGIYATNLSIQTEKTFQDEIEMYSVKIPVAVCRKMEQRKVSFQGYITLDDVENFIKKEEQELRMENKMIVTFEDLKENKELILQIVNKLVKENVIKEKSSSFFKILETLKFVPATNLRKILEVNCEGHKTFSKWMQEMKKRELLQFFPYIYADIISMYPNMILSYDKSLEMNHSHSAVVKYGAPNNCISNNIFEEYEIYEEYEEYLKSKYRKSDMIEGYFYVDIKGCDWLGHLCGEKIDNTLLSQVIFYMWLMNVGNISMEFQAMMRKKEGKELLDYFVRISAEKEMFQTFDIKFDDLNQFISKQFYLFLDGSEFCILEKEKEVGDIKDKDCFRIPALNDDYDLCRVVVYSSLKIAIEHDDSQREVITLNLEPLLEQISSLEEKEKQEILTNIDIKILVIIFGLNLANIGISNRNVYAMQSLSMMRKWEKGLPEVYNLNDLYDMF